MSITKVLLILLSVTTSAFANPEPKPEIYDFYASYGEIDLNGDPAYAHAKKCTNFVGKGTRSDLWNLLFRMQRIVLRRDGMSVVFENHDDPKTHVTQNADESGPDVEHNHVFGTWHQMRVVGIPKDVSRRLVIRVGPLQTKRGRRPVLISLVRDRNNTVECYEQWSGSIGASR